MNWWLSKPDEPAGTVKGTSSLEETIKQRLATFHNQTKPVVDHYSAQDKLHKVNSENAPDVVFGEVEKIFDSAEKRNKSIFCCC